MDRNDFEQWKGRDVARLLSLVESERRYYQEVIAALPVPIAILRPDRSLASANRAFRQLFDSTVDELRGRLIENILPSDSLIEKIRESHVHGFSRSPFWIEARDTSYRVALVPIRSWNEDTEMETLLVVEDAGGLPVSGAAAPEPRPVAVGRTGAVDVDRLPAVIWQANPSTLTFTAVSGSGESLLGFKPDQWIQRATFFSDRIHDGDRDAVLALYRSTIANGGEASAEFRAMTATGDTLWCRETIFAPSRGTGGTLTGVLAAIPERKQAERQRIVAERHAALTNISGRLAHDLNNPLMVLAGYAEEMRHYFEPGDPRQGDVEQVLAAADRISSLASQLLQFTRPTTSAPVPVNLATALAKFEPKLAQAAGAASLEVLRGAPVEARADAAQLERVLLALISGGGEGRTRISIACDTETIREVTDQAVLAPGTYARIIMEDNGKRLEPAKQAAVFETFFSKDPEKTAGVGLAYAYRMVREWGGDIAIESGPSRGTQFVVYLPFVGSAASRPDARQATQLKPSSQEAPRQRILVVDDESGIRTLVAKILQRENYEVLEAGSLEDALAIVAKLKSPINLLVTDVMLGDKSGRALAEKVVQAVPGVKVLYISGFTDDESVRTGQFPPGSKYLQKPFTLGALLGRVREALES